MYIVFVEIKHIHIRTAATRATDQHRTSADRWRQRTWSPRGVRKRPASARQKHAPRKEATRSQLAVRKQPASARPPVLPASAKRPADVLVVDPALWQRRVPRGLGSGRKSTAKSVEVRDAKHPHKCASCVRYVGFRCESHCGAYVLRCQ